MYVCVLAYVCVSHSFMYEGMLLVLRLGVHGSGRQMMLSAATPISNDTLQSSVVSGVIYV